MYCCMFSMSKSVFFNSNWYKWSVWEWDLNPRLRKSQSVVLPTELSHHISDWCVVTPNSPTAVSRTSQRATNLATTPCAELFFIVRTPPLSRWRLRAISSRTVAPYPSYLSPTPNCTCATSRRHPYFNGILIEDNRVFVLVTPWGYPYRTKFAGMVFLWRKSTMRIVVCSHYLLKLFRGWTLSVPPFNHLRRVRDLNPRAVFTTYLFSKQTPSPTWVTLQKKQNLTHKTNCALTLLSFAVARPRIAPHFCCLTSTVTPYAAEKILSAPSDFAMLLWRDSNPQYRIVQHV